MRTPTAAERRRLNARIGKRYWEVSQSAEFRRLEDAGELGRAEIVAWRILMSSDPAEEARKIDAEADAKRTASHAA